MSTRLTSLVLGVAAAAAAVGAGFELAGADSAAGATLVLLFLAVAPTAAIAGLLGALDGFPRLIIACTADITVLALTAIIMLAGGFWSPTGGLVAVVVITAACLAAQLPTVRRGSAARAARWRQAAAHFAARPGPSGTKARLGPAPAAHRRSSVPVAAAAGSAPDAATSEFRTFRGYGPPLAAAAPDAPTSELPAIGGDEPVTAAAPDAPTSNFPAWRARERPAVPVAEPRTAEYPVIGNPDGAGR